MSYVDTHNHQAGWSVDASIPLQELVKEARDLGLLGVTLTDHYDYNGEADNDWCLDVDAYIEHMKDKRQADPNDLLILTGIELGYTPEHKAHMVEVSLRPEFDHTILSLHFHRGIDPYYDPDGVVKGYENHKRFTSALINDIADSAIAVPKANTIGHYDFFSRYLPWQKSKFNYVDAPDAFDRLFSIMIENGQSLELNAGTIHRLVGKSYSLEEALPDEMVLRRYKELGGHLITIASDAHRSGKLAELTSHLLAQVNALGLTPCYFKEQKPYDMSHSRL